MLGSEGNPTSDQRFADPSGSYVSRDLIHAEKGDLLHFVCSLGKNEYIYLVSFHQNKTAKIILHRWLPIQ